VPVLLSLLSYTYIDGIAERRAPHREAHLRLIARYRAEERLAVAGAVGEPPHLGLLGFRTREDGEAFIAEDPYVAAGLVEQWRLDPWSVVAAELHVV
jgi:uncharacterized protein YciI